MRILRSSTLILYLLFYLPIHAFSQTAGAYEKKAADAVENKDYNAALAYYKVILEDNPERKDLYYKAGESARLLRSYIVADSFFKKAVDTSKSSAYPDLDYKTALVKKSLGKYDEAIALLQTHIKNNPNGTFVANAKKELADCEWAREVVATPDNIQVVHMDDRVNTIYTDMAPVRRKDTLYYTSAFIQKDGSAPVTRIYASDLKFKGKPALQIPAGDGQNTANLSISANGKRMYYTVCDQAVNGVYNCAIYYRDKGDDGQWSANPVKLSNEINQPGYTNTQPSIGRDARTGAETLYFSSDRPGGKGGMDIWAAEVKGDQFEKPVNLTILNTEKNEITPFFYNNAQVIFYSSDGLQGLGGFDVFKSVKVASGFSAPEHTGYPLNGSYDEIYYSLDAADGKAYFTSNRPGGMCERPEQDCICNDIYGYDLAVDLIAQTYLKGTEQPLTGCTIHLIDAGLDAVVAMKDGETTSAFNFPLSIEKKYRLTAKKAGFASDTVDFDTRGLYASTTLHKKLSLLPYTRLNIVVLDAISFKPLTGATISIKDDSARLISQTIPGYTFTYDQVGFGKKYITGARKDGYGADTSFVVVDPLSVSNKIEYNDTLRLTPFTGLPVTLYFDNDYPDPQTTADRTSSTYGQTFSEYISRRPEFVKMYYAGGKDTNVAGAGAIEDFFMNDVQTGNDKLMEFSSILSNYLAQGHKLEIVIEGYASPLSSSEYNRHLSERRIHSVVNHLASYNGRVLEPYLLNGGLSVRVDPYGNKTAPASVSGDPKNRKLSVFSVDASKERRVVIKEINSLGKGVIITKAVDYDKWK